MPENLSTSVQEGYTSKLNSLKGEIQNITLELKEEQLDIAKEWIQKGTVKIYRDVYMEEKNFTVPIMREELIIEQENSPTESIRIPLSEEQVEFTKHKIKLEDVSIYKQKIEEIKHIEETLKREEPKIKISGSPRIIDKSHSTPS